MADINQKRKNIENIIIMIASIILIYLLVSIYFAHHFFFNTIINGVNVSLKSHDDAVQIISDFMKDYDLQLIERDGETEAISGQDIGMQINKKYNITGIGQLQNSFQWMNSLFRSQKYFIKDLYYFNKDSLNNIVSRLNCLNKDIVEPRNVGFIYSDGSYEIISEEYGNKINSDKLIVAIKTYLLSGKSKLDLNKMLCYESPKYTLNSSKTLITRNQLNKYASTKITYQFGSKIEIVDGNVINKWLDVDENLDVIIKKSAITEYVNELSKKYDTVGITRSFRTSTGKTVDVKGGLYGWKIKKKSETNAIIESINRGEIIVKEPVYTQKALYREDNDVGNTYIEINITKQHLWFYKDGKLITEGPVVTGNPSKGNSTVVGTYKVIYKQKEATLSGPGYDAKVTYWMPFYGNMGLHDASWRYSFGGEIYKTKGTHGCVNAPFQLAKTVFENIEDGIPVIIYKEE